MPKCSSLFGKYLRTCEGGIAVWKKKDTTLPIPVKAYGRPPSAASQTGLYHDEDFNYYSKVSRWLQKKRIKVKPLVYRRDFRSQMLNTTIQNLRVTTSALHAMDDMGGLDEYILRTSPEQLRSQLGERMRQVMYFYQKHPEYRAWGLPWKVFLTASARKDPFYARHLHFLRKHRNQVETANKTRHHSPYYLPKNPESSVEHQPYSFHSSHLDSRSSSPQSSSSSSLSTPRCAGPLRLWWRDSKELDKAFRKRLGEARVLERAHADHREPGGFRLGYRIGGGGKSGRYLQRHRRSKTHAYRQIRPY